MHHKVSGGTNKLSANGVRANTSDSFLRKFRVAFAMSAISLTIIILGVLILKSRRWIMADGTGEASNRPYVSSSGTLSQDVDLLRSMTSEFLKSETMPDSDDCVAYGNLVVAVLSARVRQTTLNGQNSGNTLRTNNCFLRLKKRVFNGHFRSSAAERPTQGYR